MIGSIGQIELMTGATDTLLQRQALMVDVFDNGDMPYTPVQYTWKQKLRFKFYDIIRWIIKTLDNVFLDGEFQE
jgi:hypothetical protein